MAKPEKGSTGGGTESCKGKNLPENQGRIHYII
jgi:hypothetical protein